MNRRKFLKFVSIATGGLVLANKVITTSNPPKYIIGVDVTKEKDSTVIMESTRLKNDWFYKEYHKSANDFDYWLENHVKYNQVQSRFYTGEEPKT